MRWDLEETVDKFVRGVEIMNPFAVGAVAVLFLILFFFACAMRISGRISQQEEIRSRKEYGVMVDREPEEKHEALL